MRVKPFSVSVKIGVAILALGVCAIAAWASIDTDGPPTWSLDKRVADPDGNFAMLLPSNETRVNFYLLLADRRGVPVPLAKPKAGDPPFALFPWMVMAKRIVPKAFDSYGQYEPVEGSRCQTNASGSAAFAAALSASSDIPAPEKQRLIAMRQGLNVMTTPPAGYGENVECGSVAATPDELAGIRSAGAQEFAAYVLAVRAFYSGKFDQAAQQFGSLAAAREPWVRETADYMVGRTLLNRAIDQSMDEYGSLNEPNKRDMKSVAAAGAAFQAYLRSYPAGRYSNSARGLMRRVHWLAGDDRALAADYDGQLSRSRHNMDAPDAYWLVEEIDDKLPFPTLKERMVHDPILLAVADLQRMRKPGIESATGEQITTRDDCCGPLLTNAEIEAQRPLFSQDTELYDYIRAADAYFVRRQPAEVLRLIPDAARQKRFSYVQFSRQMLRGMALQAVGDPNTHAFWLSLFPGATQPYQHEALELALAIQEEKSGQLDLVFASDSPVQHPVMRAMLIENIAGPDILRQQASRPGVPKIERDTALYILLSKELRRGFYREFLNDVRLIPPNASDKTYYEGVETGFWGAGGYNADYNTSLLDPPLGVFGSKGRVGDFGCPALTATVTALAANPRAIRPRLCLAEFFRDNGFDDFAFDEPFVGNGLASTRPRFPAGAPYSPKDSRLEAYKSVIGDPAASPEDKAMALNRAVRCYAPAGDNSCGGIEVPLAQRRTWFVQLHTRYPGSPWAKELKHFW